METKKQELTIHLNLLKKALRTLEAILQEPYTLIVRDAAIQRFEYTFELSWKLFRKVAKLEGIEVVSPRQAIRTANDLGLLDDVDIWFEFVESRNLTSHTYDELTADEVFESAKQLPSRLSPVIQTIERKFLRD